MTSTSTTSSKDASFSFNSSFLLNPQILKTLSDNQDGFNHLKYPRDLVTADIGGVPYAIIATPGDQSVQILDLTDPENPQNTSVLVDGSGGFTTLANPHGLRVIEVDGESYLIVAAWGEDGVSIINISDPSNPTLASSLLDNQNGFDQLDRPHGIAVEQIGNSFFAFVGSLEDNGIQIIDISDPYQPTAAASLTHGGDYTLESIKRISVAQTGSKTVLLAAAQGSNAIQIIDVTDPFNPSALSLVQSIEAPSEIKSIDIGGRNYAFAVSQSNNSVQIIDFTDPVNPTKLYQFQDGVDGFNGLGGVTDVDLITDGTSTYALFASYTDNSIEVANVTDPSSPTHISSLSIDSPRHVDSLFINNKVYSVVATNNPGGVSILELGGFVDEVAVSISAPSRPDLLTASDSGSSSTDNYTNDTTPSFSGTAEAGSTVELFAGGISLGSTTADANGDWTFSVQESNVLADGSYAITATSTTYDPPSLQRTPIAPASPGRTHQEYGHDSAFAALKDDGSVITWGDSRYGGDSSGVADQLGSGVVQIFSTVRAFAALKDDGTVVTWGDSGLGGDSSGVADQLGSGVVQIFSTSHAFAALKEDGSVVTWGSSERGGDSSGVTDQLSSGVDTIFSAASVFAALKEDGSVVTWGNPLTGGDSSGVADQLSSGVDTIFSANSAFAALKDDGSVVTWGYSDRGANSSGVADRLTSGVVKIIDSWMAFAALKDDGSVVTWGKSDQGGDSSGVADQLGSGVVQIFSTSRSFAALKDDGSVVTWGDSRYGGDSSGVADQLGSDVVQIFSTSHAFAALKGDGSVVTWGSSERGGDSSGVADQLSSGVDQIFSTSYAFAALKDDGSMVTWGNPERGGNSSGVTDRLSSGVDQIFSNKVSFAALKDDGSLVALHDDGSVVTSVSAELQSGVVSFADPFHDDRLVAIKQTSDPSLAVEISIDSTAPLPPYALYEALLVENSGAGQVILTPTSSDYASVVSYSLKEGNSDDASAFSIDSSTGQVSLNHDPDFETKESYFFTVVATDQAGNSTEQSLSLRINDLDDTAPFLITQDTNLPISSNRHINVGDDGVISVQFNVEDTQSTIKEIQAVFESPSGAQSRTITIDPSNLTSEDQKITNNIFRKHFSLDNFNVDGGSGGYVEGGEWSIKELTLEDSLGNAQIINKENLPSNLKFTVNNPPSTKPSLVGQKLIGQTLTIDESTIIDADNAGSQATNHQYQWLISDDGIAWTPISDFSATQTSYDLTEADANKYFKSIVKYSDGVGTDEIVESDLFQFVELTPSEANDDFETSTNGWSNDTSPGQALVTEYNATLGTTFLGRLGGNTRISKEFDLSGSNVVIKFDFYAFDSWDYSKDTLEVKIGNDRVFLIYPENVSRSRSASGKSINADGEEIDWSIQRRNEWWGRGSVYSYYADRRHEITISVPDGYSNEKLSIISRLNSSIADESWGIDNVIISRDRLNVAPTILSESSAFVVEKNEGNDNIYLANADDFSSIKYSLAGENSDLFSINEVTGQVNFLKTAKHDRENPANNIYDFTVRATDIFGNFSEKEVNLTIEDSSLAFWKDGGYRIDSFDRSGSIPSANAVSLKDQRNRLLSDSSSRHWNGVGVIKSNDGYRMLQIGERGRRRGHYRIAELNSAGVLQNAGHWLSQSDAVANGYQELFELDLNGDGHKGIPVATDTDNNGFADGLGHYRLMGTTKNVDFKGRRGTILSARSSRSWDALMSKAKGDGSGFDVLIQGSRGRYRGKYQVWQADADGTVTSNGRWMNRQALVNEGYETTFGKDLDGDTHVGKPPSLVLETDSNNDGFVDGLGHYRLTGATPSDAVDFKGRRGTILSARSSRSWDALMSKAKGDGSGFDVLIQGSRGRYRGKYQVWQADSTGTVTSNGRWVNRDTLVNEGYETTFNTDLNGDGKTGSPLQLGPLDENSDGLVDGITNYTLFKGVSQSYGQAIALTDRRGRNLSDRSSRVWNVIRAAEDDLEFKVLVKGERGRRRSQYQVWTADSTGLITDQSSWQSGSQLALNGFEPIFGADLNGNGVVGV